MGQWGPGTWCVSGRASRQCPATVGAGGPLGGRTPLGVPTVGPPAAPRTAPGAGCEAAELGAAAPPSARLETRTKESMELACWQVPHHPNSGESPERGGDAVCALTGVHRAPPHGALRGESDQGQSPPTGASPTAARVRCVRAPAARHTARSVRGWGSAPRRGHRSRRPADRVLSACEVHGTRKVVNYTILRRSLGKPRWRAVAVLTCKLCSLSVA